MSRWTNELINEEYATPITLQISYTCGSIICTMLIDFSDGSILVELGGDDDEE